MDDDAARRGLQSAGIGASTVSHHMSVLRGAGLVDGRKDGLWTYYTLKRDVLDEAARALRSL
ncbi:MAG: ArsR family transcriptional regulator [Actinobacteria bacterium]|nr:ArsR family transcriptional regulator [Actinomycetota bacterium]MCG2807267.1 ArsR family transcriptional regulator [Coriobacteriia bacterium]